MTSSSSVNNVNGLMCADITILLLRPNLHALVRSAGIVGAYAFEEVVRRGCVPLYAHSIIDESSPPSGLRCGHDHHHHLGDTNHDVDNNDDGDTDDEDAFLINVLLTSHIPLYIGNCSPEMGHTLPHALLGLSSSSSPSTGSHDISADASLPPPFEVCVSALALNTLILDFLTADEGDHIGLQRSQNKLRINTVTTQVSRHQCMALADFIVDALQPQNIIFDDDEDNNNQSVHYPPYVPVDVPFAPYPMFQQQLQRSKFLMDHQCLHRVTLPPFSQFVSVLEEEEETSTPHLISTTSTIYNTTTTTVSLPDNFLCGCEMLEEVAINPSSPTTTTTTTFVNDDEGHNNTNTGLPHHPLHISVIGWSFMTGCKRLREINLAPFTHITTIGHQFLAGCSSLDVVDLSPFAGTVTTIRSNFMVGCLSIKEIDLTPLSLITELPEAFLSECTSLGVVDLSPLVNLSMIGHGCLSGCVSVQTVTLGRDILTSSSSLPPNRLQLTDVVGDERSSSPLLPQPTSKLENIGDDFLRNCSHVTQIQFGSGGSGCSIVGGGFGGLVRVGMHFLGGCASLSSINLTPLGSNSTLTCGMGFLAGCTSLEEVDLSVLGEGKVFFSGGGGLLEGCSSLRYLTMSDYQHADSKFFCACLEKKGVEVDVVGTMGSSSEPSSV